MTAEMIMTMIVLVFVIFLFVSEWVRVDVVGIMMMVLLPLIGLISPKEAFVGLSSNAVCSIIAVIIIGAGLDKTGVMNQVAGPIVKLAGKSEKRVITLISGTVGLISSMMQNIGAAALFLPAAQRIAKRMEVPVSRILMPMGFCAIIGGTVTLVGASPTILLNDLMVLGGKRLEPFGLFTQTPIGLCLLASAIIYFTLFGKFVLPAGEGEADKGVTAALMKEYRALETVFELHVPEDFKGPKTLEELKIRERFLVTVVAISHSAEKEKTFVPRSTDEIRPNDDIAVVGRKKNIITLAQEYGWQIKDGLEVFAESLSRTNAGMAETIVSPRSELIGKTMSEVNFKDLYGINPIALFKGNKIFYSGLTNIRLQMGDTLLLQGPWGKFHILRNRPQPRALSFATPLEGEIMRPQKAKLALGWLGVALFQIIFFKIQLSVALMSGALGMIITGVLSVDEAYRAVDWMTVFLLAGLIPLGIAFEKTGTAAFIAHQILALIGHPTPIVLLAVVGLITSFFTLVVSNVGATVLLVPLCMNMAVMAGGDPRMAALVVGLSASNTFVLPTHQVNALVMRPGGYRTMDYAKAGAVMTVIFLVVEIGVLYMLYGVK
ncbi:MAG: SLC13 family permease [Deltaproteobacteria bacterium]|nr:SLC13 family permease [Deltaproteobacteria bacterium]MBW1935469.1 SLC13 family permease [Deltaproteobacteria bacterium]MBW1978620.1 SLC13 family permease [Deltaproteobacteria bacterium]MBW2045997.1 SLC13 family permease [Deltaproteobacteria bacterium]MBW2301172.1 SLC13 family permease [Deltaproteobacteria bacterium]